MSRKPQGWPEGAESWSLDQMTDHIAQVKEKPINRAYWKLYQFVNDCVGDPDFKQSPALLHLLIILRDDLADGAAENWNLDDYLEPVLSKWKSHQAKMKNAGLRRKCQLEWLEKKGGMTKGEFVNEFRLDHEINKTGKPTYKTIYERWLSPEVLKEIEE